jgi:hypothetical protein
MSGPASRDVPARRAAERLAERARHQVDTIADSEELGRARSGRAQDAGGMGVVHHHQCVVLLGHRAQVTEGRDVAVHREHAVGDDEDAARTGGPRGRQLSVEVPQVAVRVAEPLRLRQPDAVDDRRVVQLVRDHGILVAEERLEDSAVGVEAGREEDRVLGPEPFGDLRLEGTMLDVRPADEPHARHPEPVGVEGRVCGCDHGGRRREAQIVVRAEVQETRGRRS